MGSLGSSLQSVSRCRSKPLLAHHQMRGRLVQRKGRAEPWWLWFDLPGRLRIDFAADLTSSTWQSMNFHGRHTQKLSRKWLKAKSGRQLFAGISSWQHCLVSPAKGLHTRGKKCPSPVSTEQYCAVPFARHTIPASAGIKGESKETGVQKFRATQTALTTWQAQREVLNHPHNSLHSLPKSQILRLGENSLHLDSVFEAPGRGRREWGGGVGNVFCTGQIAVWFEA